MCAAMNDLVQREYSGWPQANPISLKFLSLDGARLFNNVGKILRDDQRFIFKNILKSQIKALLEYTRNLQFATKVQLN